MTRFFSRARSVALAVLLVVPLAGSPRNALAQSPATASDLESARDLIVKGRELRDKGDLLGALEKFRAAHALAHTPVTGIELARTHVALKQPLEARDVCLGIGRAPVTREETARSREARDEAAKIAEDMRPKIATLAVKIAAPKDRTLVVKIDGAEVPAAALESRKVNPGKHVVSAHIDDGPESTTDVDVGEGETRAVALSPRVPAVAKPIAVTPPPGTSTPRPDEYVDERRMSPLVPVGFVVGGVGLVVGGVAGVLATSAKSSLQCPAKECFGEEAGDLDRAKTMATVSTIGFVVGGVGTALGVVGLLTPSTIRVRRGGLTLTPYVAGTGGGLNGTF